MASRSTTARRQKAVDFRTIRTEMLSTGHLYADPDFPPDNRSLYFNGRPPASSRIRNVIWKRPKDICRNPQPQFMVKGANRHDLDQGYLGDCWFVAGAATLASGHRSLLEKVVPPGQEFDQNYTGMFHFNFWWYGKWMEVTVDDFLPTDGQRLIYCQNRERPNEFWPPLLEKAYAKLRGCYDALQGGKLQDSLVDLTGGISEVINLQNKNQILPNLYELLTSSYAMKSLVGASIFRPEGSTESEIKMRNGLFQGHAYSITGLQQLKTNNGGVIRLLRLRNPWGHGEWNGPWSDQSPEMNSLPDSIKKELNFQAREEGEFWISFEDFVRNFDELQFCHLQPDAMLEELADNQIKQNWNITVYHDEWIRGVTAGGCGNSPNENIYWKNPQFYVDLSTPDTVLSQSGTCTIIVSLMEKEANNQSQIAIGFDIYKLKRPDLRPLNERRAPSSSLLLAKRSGKYVYYREVTKRFQLQPGHYVIIASTYQPHEEAKFLLRIFTEKYIQSSVMEEDVTTNAVLTSPKDFFMDLFSKYSGSDSQMDAVELQKFLEVVSEEDIKHKMVFSLEQCRSLLPLMDESRTGRLNANEVKRLWKEIKAYRDVFVQFDVDKSNSVDTFELANMFSKLGFPLSRQILTSIVRRYGDRNNKISVEDFVVVITRLIQLFNVYMQQEKNSGKPGVAEFTRNEFLQHTMYL